MAPKSAAGKHRAKTPDLDLDAAVCEVETAHHPHEGIGSLETEPITISSSPPGQAFPTEQTEEANFDIDQFYADAYPVPRDPPCASFALKSDTEKPPGYPHLHPRKTCRLTHALVPMFSTKRVPIPAPRPSPAQTYHSHTVQPSQTSIFQKMVTHFFRLSIPTIWRLT